MKLQQTPSQTVGPFFSIGLIFDGQNVLASDLARGSRIIVRGQVLDGDGLPISDALVEVWQADAQGIYAHPHDPRHAQVDEHFRGFGRSGTGDRDLHYAFRTIKPGPVPWEGGQFQAPHLNVHVFARGMLIHAMTRLYFPDEPANERDPVLSSIVEPERRRTLIAVREENGDLPTYRFDIRLQGEDETVFFDP